MPSKPAAQPFVSPSEDSQCHRDAALSSRPREPNSFRQVYKAFILDPESSRLNYERNRLENLGYFDDSADTIDPLRVLSEIAYRKAHAIAFCEAQLVERFRGREIILLDSGAKEEISELQDEFCVKGVDLLWDNQ